jgi:hypothetical protein
MRGAPDVMPTMNTSGFHRTGGITSVPDDDALGAVERWVRGLFEGGDVVLGDERPAGGVVNVFASAST